MRLTLERADCFWADLVRQVDWYRDKAGPEVAVRFVDAVETPLADLTRTPGLGRLRFQNWPGLEGMHSFQVRRPFHRLIVFYCFDPATPFAERLIHGARDLPRRLRQSPDSEGEQIEPLG